MTLEEHSVRLLCLLQMKDCWGYSRPYNELGLYTPCDLYDVRRSYMLYSAARRQAQLE